MKKLILVVSMLVALLIGGCASCDYTLKDAEITRLHTELSRQQGARTAELEFGERQASIYLGCKKFFNLCSTETIALGQQALQSGFSGSTSVWYWLGFFGLPVSFSMALGVFLAVLSTISSYLQLKIIEPSRQLVEQSQILVDTAEKRARVANLRATELEKGNGILRKERHHLTHPPKARIEPVALPIGLTDAKDINRYPPVIKLPVKQDDF
ncbi:MAG: hypothetical protein BWK72_12205 [Rhodoferax ferrireducens]|uniref:Lipoprotein n=1 Tax=Rhodoferax ferrireducens TaxID=192843 RepID=A0A1W9KTD4_9BURK|nr:MAG: hypothetical protein BWK72_12205 [Rhodoferax ferrireducens]